MAIYHLHTQVIGRSSGKCAVASAAYRSGEKMYDNHNGLAFDYTRKQNIDHTEIIAPDHAPVWVQDRETLWNQVEKVERRKDAQLARELNVALPKELNKNQQIELVRNFSREQFVNKGMIADVACHNLDGDNPHAHIMLTTREITPEGFGKKNREWNDRELHNEWREQWANCTNKALEKVGSQERIDHRSLKDQGIQREPQIHVGPHAAAMEKKGMRTERGEQNRKIIDFNEARKRLRKEANELNNDIKEFQAEVIQFKAQKKEPPKQPSAPISEPTRPPVVQQSQPKPSMPVQKEVNNGAISIDEWKKQISQAREDSKQDKVVQVKPFQEIKADYDQARIEWGRQQELVDRIESQLRSEIYKLEKYKNIEKQVNEIEEKLGSLSRFNPFNRSEIKQLEQRMESLIKDKQNDFGELIQKHFEQRIMQLNQKMQVEKKKMPELTARYKQTKDVFEQRLLEAKTLERQKNLDKSEDLLERYKAGEKLTTQETKLLNSFSKELGIKKISIEMDRGR